MASSSRGGRDGTAAIEGTNTLTLRGPLGQEIQLAMEKDFKVLPVSTSGKVTSPIVFAGYGATGTIALIGIAPLIAIALNLRAQFVNKQAQR